MIYIQICTRSDLGGIGGGLRSSLKSSSVVICRVQRAAERGPVRAAGRCVMTNSMLIKSNDGKSSERDVNTVARGGFDQTVCVAPSSQTIFSVAFEATRYTFISDIGVHF